MYEMYGSGLHQLCDGRNALGLRVLNGDMASAVIIEISTNFGSQLSEEGK
jgi:hypothetical protein